MVKYYIITFKNHLLLAYLCLCAIQKIKFSVSSTSKKIEDNGYIVARFGMPLCDNGTRAGLRPVPFGLPGSIPGRGVFIELSK